MSIIIRLLSIVRKFFPIKLANDIRALEDDSLTVHTLRSFDEYVLHRNSLPEYEGCKDLHGAERKIQQNLPFFFIRGECSVCSSEKKLYTDFRYGKLVDGIRVPNWRERLICLRCLLKNRQRASYHLFLRLCRPDEHFAIYITEQYGPYFRMLKSRFPATTGSEYFGDSIAFGQIDRKGRRNEDLCALSFEDASFEVVLTYDVLEHIPNYKEALSEICRILKPGGNLMISVPFNQSSADNIVRARLNADGTVEHLLEPEYHGNPIKNDGCLCFYHFGWELLDDLRFAGFDDAGLMFYWSKKYGYLGGEQIMIFAKKSK